MGVGYNIEHKSMKGFNSQICTTMEQSERLIALGINMETADMCWMSVLNIEPKNENDKFNWIPAAHNVPCYNERIRPSWSLHRLLCMLEKHPYEIYLDANVYDDVIDDIAEAIRIDEFNKDYIRYFIGVDVGEDDII